MKKICGLGLVSALILLILSLATILPVFAAPADSNGNTSGQGLMPQFTLFSIGYGYLVQKFSPIPKWENEIDTLTEDQRFIERWMLLNTDPEGVQRAQQLLEKTQEKKAVIQKKLSRFKRWFYPAVHSHRNRRDLYH